MLRRVVFWLHLIAGVLAGVVILVMSVTGVLLAYEKQILAWADRGSAPADAERLPPGAPRLPLETLAQKAQAAASSETLPSNMTFYSGSRWVAASMAGAAGGRGGNTVYIDGYSGDALGAGSPQARAFFRSVTNWHRHLAAPQDYRAAGRAITGAANLAFLFIVISGLVIWWPAKLRNLRQVTWFRRGLNGKARNWNWHNVFGFWAAVPLFFVALSGVVISYSWASNLVYRATGTEPPAENAARQQGQPQQNQGAPQDRAGRGPDEGQRQNRGQGRGRGRDQNAESRDSMNSANSTALRDIDSLITRVENDSPGWKTIALRLPASNTAPLVVTIDRGNGGQPYLRSTLTLDRTGGIVRNETFADQNAGRQARSWLRYVHTGEYYGVAGQTIAGLASLAGVMLVWTGLSLAWRRFLAWARPRRNLAGAAATQPAES